MQTDIEQADAKFYRVFHWINICWLCVSILSLGSSTSYAFTHNPAYLHDWHLPAILFLVLAVLGIYSLCLFSRAVFRMSHTWPPPFRLALSFWLGLYVGIFLLTLIDENFGWGYFILMGLCYALFNGKRLLLLIAFTYLNLCASQGYFTWPVTGDKLGSLFGIGIAFFSMTVFCIMVQHLIKERYARSRLLQELAHSNHELEEAHRQLAETAAHEQELAVLRERTRLAREMHDTLGHALVLISVKLEAAQRLRERNPTRADHELEETKDVVRSSMAELRASIANLRSPVLEREPSSRALSNYARDMALRTNLLVEYDLQPDILSLPETIEETLWKVGQEALTNVEKHAHAHNVRLHLHRQDGNIVLRVIDDGVGLPTHIYQPREDGNIHCNSPVGHYGLCGMQERVERVHGTLHIESAPGQGTSIEVHLPLVESPLVTAD